MRPTDSTALAAILTTLGTEFASKIAAYLNQALNPTLKRLIALAFSTGFLNLGLVHIPNIVGVPASVNSAIDAVILWVLSMVLHDFLQPVVKA